MSGEYRDELAAAHSRIAELEEKVRSLEEEARPSSHVSEASRGQFPDLEQRVEALRGPADEGRNGRLRTIIASVSAVFPLIGMAFTFMHLPLVAPFCTLIFVALLIYNFSLASSLKRAKTRLSEAEQMLSDARRIWELEAKLAAVPPPGTPEVAVRIATAPTPAADLLADLADPSMTASRATR